MCIIIYKPERVKIPSESTLNICWENNKDGAGFMYRSGNSIRIDKGYMKFESFMDRLNEVYSFESQLVIHMRIATSGGISPSKCHPFPISSNVDELNAQIIDCNSGIVHNGVLGTGNKNFSDTQLFIKNILSSDIVINNQDNRVLSMLLKTYIGTNRLLIMSQLGIKMYGAFEQLDGVMYSNSSFREPKIKIYKYNDVICTKSLSEYYQCPKCDRHVSDYINCYARGLIQCSYCNSYFDLEENLIANATGD